MGFLILFKTILHVKNFSFALSFTKTIQEECETKTFMTSTRRKRSNQLNGLFHGYFKLKKTYPILKPLLKFCTIKNLFTIENFEDIHNQITSVAC